jgi:PPOX class probable F420-dependent enzyme
LDLDAARAYLRTHHRAVLATMRRDGTPQLSPVACTVDDAGRVIVSSRETAVKTKNVRRDPRAWVCALPDEFFGDRFVQVEGVVSVLSLPEAMEPLVEYYRGISGEHPDWDDYRQAMEREQRVLLRLDLTRAGPDVSG